MHVYFISRGIKHEVDRFINELSSQYLDYESPHPNDFGTPGAKIEKWKAQVHVRPIQLWEVVFPSRHKDAMLTTIFDTPKDRGKNVTTQHPRHNKYLWFMRKALGVQKCPDTWNTSVKIPLWKQGVSTSMIGIKDDYWVKDGKTVPKETEGAWEAL